MAEEPAPKHPKLHKAAEPQAVPPISEQIKQITESTNAFLYKVPIAKNLSEKTGQPPAVLAAGAAGLMCLIILWSHGFDALCNLVGFVYPLYASFKALKSEGKGDDTQWLTYWVVFGAFVVFEDFADAIFERNIWSTVYFLSKLFFLLWCQSPQYKGANWVFNHVIYPILKKYEKDIDSLGAVAEQQAADVAENAIAKAAANRSSKKAT